jgi:hypothetical protein
VLTTKTLVISGEGGVFTAPNGQRGAMLRAYDKATGKEVGALYLPGAQTGGPTSYMLNGRQYILVAVSGAVLPGEIIAFALPESEPRVVAARLPQNPLITTRMSPSLGDNINGPSVIRVPAWVKNPLGRYYMYFAHHMGGHLRLAYADRVAGPWRIHEPGVLPVSATAFYRPQPDPPEALENFYTHVASPEVYVDEPRQRLVMWFHGWYTNGERWPADEAAARQWARERGYAQLTQAAESTDGLSFAVNPAITRASYLRVFPHDGMFYAMARLGVLLRSGDPLAVFEPGPNPFAGGPYAGRIRHVAVLKRDRTLYTFFTGIGDAPERIMMSTIDLSGPWTGWRASEPIDVLAPAAPFECTNLQVEPSAGGDVKGPVRQLRDPALFEDDGRLFLFYAYCGEQGIAAAELTL